MTGSVEMRTVGQVSQRRRSSTPSLRGSDKEEEREVLPWALWQRLLMVGTAFFVSISMSGITVAHLAFREMLLRSRDYLCDSLEASNSGHPCYVREAKLNSIFFFASILSKVLAAPLGLALDQWGARRCTMCGCVVFALGCVMLARSNLALDGLHYAGYVVLAAGGMCVYIPSLVMVRILPDASEFLLAVMTTAFDVSAAIFLLFLQIMPLKAPSNAVNHIFGWYLLVPLVGFVLVTSFYPDGQIPRLARLHPPSVPERSCRNLVGSMDFWLMALFTGALTTRFLDFLTTFHVCLGRTGLLWADRRELILGFQGFLPLGGFIATSAIGQLLHAFSLGTNSFIVWAAIVLAWSPLVCRSSFTLQATAIILGCLLRPYFYALTNQMCDRLFGERSLGRAYGMTMVVTGLMNAMSLASALEGLPVRTWFSVQALHLVRLLGLLSFFLPIYLYRRGL